MIAYHDIEWGMPVSDDRLLFEMLVLEGAQAGLSWATILAKRDNYRRAFAGFDPSRVARFTARRVDRLMHDPGLVRHRGKLEAAVANARACVEIQQQSGSLAAFLWDFVDGRPVQNRWRRMADVPASTPLSGTMSRELRRRGMRFVGPTTCYAFMQACGFVNDHLVSCPRHREMPRRAVDPDPASA